MRILLTMLGSCILCTACGCTLGRMERDIRLGGNLSRRDLAFVREMASDADDSVEPSDIEITVGGRFVENEKGDRSRYVWFFPLHASRKTVVVSDGLAGASRASETPAIFPGMSIVLGLRQESGATFKTEDGTLLDKASFLEVNPIVRFAYSRERGVMRGWDFAIGKGLLGVGNSPYGPCVQLLWFIKLGEGGDHSYQNVVRTVIRPAPPAEPETDAIARDVTGAVLHFLLVP